MRVLAAMSGGVDSAVAAARVRDAGHDVTGVHLALSRNRQSFRDGARGCCTIEDSHDARRAADMLGIPFYIWDMSERFHEDVIDDFVSEYQAGRTPNPCLRCNEKIKFAAVLDKARALGFDAVATGHYAQLLDGPGTKTGGRELHRAEDPGKDQSYVLAVLDEDQLAHSLFPLGGDYKTAVRAEAAERGLYVAKKPDSHDVCFIPDGDTKGFLAKHLGGETGPIVDTDGRQVGEHEGAFGYTIGQRRGLRIGDPAGDGRPRYVLDISPVTNTVTVGTLEDLDVSALGGIKLRWCGPEFTGRIDCHVQLRAHGEPVPAVAIRDGITGAGSSGASGTSTTTTAADTMRIELLEPVRGVAPGQAAVLYDGTRVIGSATIAATTRTVDAETPGNASNTLTRAESVNV